MASQVFYRKWRPQTLGEIVGQEQVTRTLRQALSTGRVSHAYLFCGPRGTGKTSTGRILAKAVNCLKDGKGEPCNACEMCQAITEGRALDIIEIDAASNRGIDEIRNLRERVNYAPTQARRKVYIIDEVHMLTREASNALLKTLEEPPPHTIFILATTETHKVLPTIMSRCQHFDFRRLTQADVAAKLEQICQAEAIKIEAEGLRLIARAATGSLRDAENLLEQLTTYYGAEIGLEQVKAMLGISGDWRARELAKHIVNSDVTSGMATLASVASDGLDLAQFNREVVELLRGLLLTKSGADESLDLTADDRAELKALAAGTSLPHILKALKLFGQLDLGLHTHSTLPLELALVESLPSPAPEIKTSPPPRAEPAPPRKTAQPVASPQAKETAAPAAPVKKAAAPKAASVKPTPTPAPAPAPEPAPAAAVQPRITASGNGDTLKELKQSWKAIIEQAPEDLRRSPALAILRSGARPVSIEGDLVVIAFRHDLHRENMEKIENQKIVVRMLSDFMGRACRIQCVKEDRLLKEAFKLGAEVMEDK